MYFNRLLLFMLSFVVGLLCSSFLSPALADGFRNPFQSASAAAQGAAFGAQADDPSAIHYNPAGMTKLPGVQHSFGVAFVNPNTTFSNSGGVKVENSISGGAVGLPPPRSSFCHLELARL